MAKAIGISAGVFRLITRSVFFSCVALMLTSCSKIRLFHPVGPVAQAEYHYTLLSTGIMMLIILPTTIALGIFVWRYRKPRNAAYDPEFSHSMALELGMWGVPIAIVVVLAFCTYSAVYAVNPADPGALGPVAAGAPQPLEVDVITTDWQWLFIYPKLGLATIDDLVVPQGQTVKFQLTSATVVNDFYIPQIVPMIDVMPGMRTQSAFRVDRPGNYEGFSADFSGAGFSWMEFSTRILPPSAFAAWVKQAQTSNRKLDFAAFQTLAKPTINQDAAPMYFSPVDPNLFREVYDAVRNGEVFPVPIDIDTKAQKSVPGAGAASSKPKS